MNKYSAAFMLLLAAGFFGPGAVKKQVPLSQVADREPLLQAQKELAVR